MDIVILDTGCANLYSITIAIKKLGYNAIVTSDPSIVHKSHKIIIPGVGTAIEAMKRLLNKKLVDVIQTTNKPVLGICLGMQLLCNFSEEGHGVQTLGIINSIVSRLKTHDLPLPHIGWNQINFNSNHILFKNIETGSRFYFVHSYFIPINIYTLAVSTYGISFSSVIQKNNFFGVQFHPEKSGNAGSQILKNFIEM